MLHDGTVKLYGPVEGDEFASRLALECQRDTNVRTAEAVLIAPAFDDEQAYFTQPEEQRTLFQEGVCGAGWVAPLPEPKLELGTKPAPRLELPEDQTQEWDREQVDAMFQLA